MLTALYKANGFRDVQVITRTIDNYQGKTATVAAELVINEGPRLHAQLQKMKPLANPVDILVVDGGSTDGSVEPAVLARMGVNTLLVKTGPGKLSAQMRMALAFALERGYEGVVTIDGNDKDDPSAVHVQIIERGALWWITGGRLRDRLQFL